MSELKNRNSSIDLLKLYFAIIVMLFHFGQRKMHDLFPLGYIVVEGFFMITGYFMMSSVSKAKSNDIGRDTLKFIGHKMSSFFLPLLFSTIIAFGTLILKEDYIASELIFNTFYLLSEIFPLQITGLKSIAPTGVSWYLSAMMLALLMLYPIARATGSKFTRIICPLLVFLIYGSLCREFNQIGTTMDLFFDTPIRTGLLRGIAGICAGCMLFDCVKSTEHYKASRFGEICFFGVEILCFAFITLYMYFFPRIETDYFVLPVFFILLYCLFGRKSLFSKKFSFNASKHLGTASLLIYLNHNYWTFYIADVFPDLSAEKAFAVYLLLITASCVAVYAATLLTQLLWQKTKPFLKKHFVGK